MLKAYQMKISRLSSNMSRSSSAQEQTESLSEVLAWRFPPKKTGSDFYTGVPKKTKVMLMVKAMDVYRMTL
ncbi:MAG: hypothetical protein GY861_01325 [bacterium]|nr:hypothetical protein [bacterium]